MGSLWSTVEHEGITIPVLLNAEMSDMDRPLRLKRQANIVAGLFPMPRVLVSCRDITGENNVLAAGCCSICSFDPLTVIAGLAPTPCSYKLMKQAGCFTVNLVDKHCRDLFEAAGASVDKTGPLPSAPAEFDDSFKINASLLRCSPVNIECEIVDTAISNTKEMYFGRIVYIHACEEFIDEAGNVDLTKIDLL